MICVTVAHRTMTPFAGVRIPHPLPKRKPQPKGVVFFLPSDRDSNNINANARWAFACCGLGRNNTMILSNPSSKLRLAPPPKGWCFYFALDRDSNNSNAARISAAGEGLTEPYFDEIESLILCRRTPTAVVAGICIFLWERIHENAKASGTEWGERKRVRHCKMEHDRGNCER